MLTESEKTMMSTTRSDLKRLAISGVAMLRGTACAAELNAMAAMAKPGKTKLLSAESRGVLAFQSTLDRFANLITKADDDKILATGVHKIHDSTNPVDACLEATPFDNVCKGKSALVNDHGLLMFARGIYIQLKAKYGERLNAERSLTLKAKVPKKVQTASEKAKAAFAAMTPAERAALIAEVTGISPASEIDVSQLETAQNTARAV